MPWGYSLKDHRFDGKAQIQVTMHGSTGDEKRGVYVFSQRLESDG